MRTLLCIFITTTMIAAPAGAQISGGNIPAPAPDRLNAATWYQRAFEKYHAARMTAAENMAMWRFEVDPSLGPSPAVRQFLHRIEPAINLTRRAAHQRAIDFGIDAGDGPEISLDHLGQLRALIWLVSYDMQFKLAESDHYGAADRLATMYRMANHASVDPVLVGSFVGYGMFEFAERSMRSALDHAAIGQQEAAVLVRAMEQFDHGDPFRLRQAIANQRRQSTQWMLEQFSGEGGVDKLKEQFDAIPLSVDEPAREAIASLDQEHLEAELKSADRMMQRIVEAFAKPEKALVLAELAQIHDQAQKGEFGKIAPHLEWGSVDQCTLLLGAREAVVARLAKLKSLADGTTDPMDLANAAVWYMRAIAVLPRIDPQKFAKVREYASVHSAAASAELASTLDSIESQTIIENLTRATQIRRCDFSYTTAPWPTVLRRYHPGLRDLARLLLADAARQVHSGHEDQYAVAAQRLAMVNRLCAHLAEDKSIVSSLVAHAAFKEGDALAAAAINAKYFHGESLREFARSVRLRAADPFGYEAAITEMRMDVEKRSLWLTSTAEAGPRRKVHAFVKESSPDRLLWLQALLDEGEQPLERGAAGADAYLQNLDEIINAEAFHDSMAQSDIVQRMIAKGDFEAIAGFEFPVIANLKQKQEEAFTDLRECLARLKRPIAPR